MAHATLWVPRAALWPDAGPSLTECPCWMPEANAVVCAAVEEGAVIFIGEDRKVRLFQLGERVGALALAHRFGVIAVTDSRVVLLDVSTGVVRDGPALDLAHDEIPNDGKVAPNGEFVFGTKHRSHQEPIGRLFAVSKRGEIRVLRSGFRQSNGFEFAGSTLYHIDTPTRSVMAYEADQSLRVTGSGVNVVDWNSRAEAESNASRSVPDGMARDLGGAIYVAEWGGGRVSMWNAETKPAQSIGEIIVPTATPSSCCFGGRNWNELYVTSERTSQDDLGGGIFVAQMASAGSVPHRYHPTW